MKDLATTILAASKNQAENDAPYRTLVEVFVPMDPRVVIRLANSDRDVNFDFTTSGSPLVWQRFPIALGDFLESKNGDLSQFQVGIIDTRLELRALVDQYRGLIGSEIRISIVNAAALGDTSARLFYIGEVVECECDEESIVFTIGQPSLNEGAFPGRRWFSKCSVVSFGDSDCGYPIPTSPTNAVGGGFDFCPRTLNACRERGADELARGLVQLHPRRFDGAPGMVSGNE